MLKYININIAYRNQLIVVILPSMYKHDNIIPDSDSNLSKKEQVAAMFDNIAGKYDFFNRFLSMGIDKSWRKKALAFVKEVNPSIVLDVATGTADIALMMHKIVQPKRIEGIDISAQMLEIGKDKVKAAKAENVINLQIGDSEAIKFDANSFDAVTVAYGVRNFENLELGLSEIKRVLHDKGRVVVLEFSKPKQFVWQKLYNVYMGIVAPKMVGAFSKNKKAYQYLNNSVNAFPERDNFIAVLNKVGFKNSFYKELSFGICCIYVAEK
jgi:demethylmenaquinone methyltransferase / 2-methoxy-6-polyprenyl-1,4-benzoquinol methylase